MAPLTEKVRMVDRRFIPPTGAVVQPGMEDGDDDDSPTDDAASDDGPEHQTFQMNYAITKKISKGNYGVVYRTTQRATLVEYAVKVICRGSLAKFGHGDAMVEREIELLQACRDIENVVNVIEYFRTPRYYYIVQNYAPVRVRAKFKFVVYSGYPTN
jgi:serine/threonine protein kinase